MPLGRKIRYGMVGGGPGAFIGGVHRKAAALDGEIELVAGAFSSDPEKSRQQGAELFLDSSRVYGSYADMAEKEAGLPEGSGSISCPSSRLTTYISAPPRRSSRPASPSCATSP